MTGLEEMGDSKFLNELILKQTPMFGWTDSVKEKVDDEFSFPLTHLSFVI